MEQSPEESDRDAVSPEPKAVSRLVTRLEDLARGQESVPIEDLVATIGAQGQAPLLMTVAIFMISPIGMVPGVGGALGLVVAALGIQMIAGRGELWLPRFIRHRTLSARRIRGTARRIRPAANWLRRHLRIRMERLAS
ncbi:exopolysaccharide biosynthesis protein, partial [Thioclava sp. BHET1]